MERSEAAGAMQTVGAVAALGLFLPSIDKSWESDDRDTVRRVRTGEVVYLGSVATIALLASYAHGSPLPFLVGFGLALVIVGMHEHALRHRS